MTYLIGVEMDRHTKDTKPYVYAGNAQGEVYIYQVSNLDSAFSHDDEEAQLPQAQLDLVDIILTKEPCQVR